MGRPRVKSGIRKELRIKAWLNSIQEKEDGYLAIASQSGAGADQTEHSLHHLEHVGEHTEGGSDSAGTKLGHVGSSSGGGGRRGSRSRSSSRGTRSGSSGRSRSRGARSGGSSVIARVKGAALVLNAGGAVGLA